jgi:hypothetical protein
VLTSAGSGGLALPNPLEGLPDVDPLAVASHDVVLIGVDLVCARPALHGVLDGGDIPRLDDIAAAAAVEPIH